MSRSDVARPGWDPIDVHVGLAVKAGRIRQNMTQADLGRAIGVSFQQVQKYEKGMNRMSASMLVRAADAIGCGVSDFFPKAGEMDKADDPPIASVKGGREMSQLFARSKPGQRALVLELMREMTQRTRSVT